MHQGQIKLTKYQEQLIEELGVLYEKSNHTPVTARILALLVVADHPELTFDAIRETLNISKSAASNALNLLLLTKSVTYVTRPHDRKRYFSSCFGQWNGRIREHFEHLDDVIVVLTKILNQRPAETVEFNQDLGNVIRFVEFMAGEIPLLIKKWEKVNQHGL